MLKFYNEKPIPLTANYFLIRSLHCIVLCLHFDTGNHLCFTWHLNAARDGAVGVPGEVIPQLMGGGGEKASLCGHLPYSAPGRHRRMPPPVSAGNPLAGSFWRKRSVKYPAGPKLCGAL